MEKYSSIKLKCNDVKSIAFDSRGFDLNENMFFTFHYIGMRNFLFDEIQYKFENDVQEYHDNGYIDGKRKDPLSSSEVKQDFNEYSIKNYYKISNEENKNYLLIGFHCTNEDLTIENTKDNEGKKIIIIVIIVFVVFFVIIIVIIVICCIRRRKARAARMAMRMQMASGAYYPPPGMGMGMSVGVGMPPAYGGNYMMNNMPPQPNMMGSQPVAYSRMPNDATQIEPNAQNPDEIPQPNSGMRIKKTKV